LRYRLAIGVAAQSRSESTRYRWSTWSPFTRSRSPTRRAVDRRRHAWHTPTDPAQASCL